jgi:hypothetical protein
MEIYNSFITPFLTAVSILAGVTMAGYLTMMFDFYKEKWARRSMDDDPVTKNKSRLLCLLRWSSLLYIFALVATINLTLAHINEIPNLTGHLNFILIIFSVALILTFWILLPQKSMKSTKIEERNFNQEDKSICIFIIIVVVFILYLVATNICWYS